MPASPCSTAWCGSMLYHRARAFAAPVSAIAFQYSSVIDWARRSARSVSYMACAAASFASTGPFQRSSVIGSIPLVISAISTVRSENEFIYFERAGALQHPSVCRLAVKNGCWILIVLLQRP